MSRSTSAASTIVSLIIIVVMVFIGSCRGVFADKDMAIRALEKQGYSQISITDRTNWFMGCNGCSGYDAARFDARVRNAAGKDVTVYVCVGWPFKGATVRTD